MAYVLDSDVLIEARKRHYSFDICPGFWDWIALRHKAGAVFSIEKVRDEIRQGSDELVAWADQQPSSFFAPVDTQTLAAFSEVSTWATSQSFNQAAVSEFLQKADFYLVAHALAHSLTVVTHERTSNSLNTIKIPDACEALGVRVMNPFEMLRSEGARFILDAST